MPTIYFGSVSKRSNSTMQHSDSVECEVQIKHPSTKWNPVFLIATTDDFTYHPDTYNSVTWNDRQYYIDDISYVHHNLWEVHCSIDYLATWKSEIGSTSGYILYSTSTYNAEIPDKRLSTENYAEWNSTEKTMPEANVGYYFVSYIGTDDQCQVLLSESQLGALSEVLLTDDNLLESIINNTLGDTTIKKLESVYDCITECHYIPYTPALGEVQSLTLGGGYTSGVAGYLAQHLNYGSTDLTIPWNFTNTANNGLGDFRNRSPYSAMGIYLPGYGFAQLNIDEFLGMSELTVSWNLDVFDGSLVWLVDGRIPFACNIAVPVQLGTVSNGSLVNTVAAAASTVGSMVSGDIVGSAIGAFNTAISATNMTIGSVGSNGGSAFWGVEANVNSATITLFIQSHDTTVTPSTMAPKYGRPYNGIGTVSSSGGFVQMVNAHVECDAPKSINDLIDNELNGGLFYE